MATVIISCRLPDPARGRTRYGTRVHYLMQGNGSGEPSPFHPWPDVVYTFCGRKVGRRMLDWGEIETTDPLDCSKCLKIWEPWRE